MNAHSSRVTVASALLAALASTACGTSAVKGQCTADANCAPGSTCDVTQSPAVCVVPQGACFPSCQTGFSCVSGACVTSTCTPVCGPSQICDPATVTCKDVTVPTITLTSPASGTYTGSQLQVTATARAPGGVNGVKFEVRKTDEVTVIGSADGVASATDAANFYATVLLNGAAVVDGEAHLYAVMSYPNARPQTSDFLKVIIDRTPPALGTVTPPAAWLGPNSTGATVTAVVTDSGAGLSGPSVKLALLSKSYVGTPGASNSFTFAVPLADLGVAADNSASVPFTLEAADTVGNKLAPVSNAAYVIKVDLKKPAVAISADTKWYLASATVPVAGTVTENESGLTGGSAGVSLTPGTVAAPGTPVAPGTFPTSSTLAASFAVGGQSVADGFEGPLAYFVSVTDAAGNVGVASGAANVDNRGPQISAIAVTTAADATRAADGKAFYKASGGTNLTVTATVADASGVVNPCLKVVGTGGALGSCITGAAGGSNLYTFLLPRSAGATSDGLAPVQFVITADDGLVANASGAEKSKHQSQSAATDVYFDTKAPVAAALAVDNTWYAKLRSGSTYTLPVTASFTEGGVGVSATVGGTLTVGSTTVPSTSCTATACTFALPTSAAVATHEEALAFTVTVQDLLGNVSTSQAGARNLDDKAPALGTVTPPVAWVGPSNTTATVTAVVTEGGSGISGTSVKLALPGLSKSYVGTPGASNSYSFTVPLADLGVAADSSASVAFTLEAADAVGNALLPVSNGAYVIKVDLKKPAVTLTTDSTYYLASATVAVAGTVTENESGLTGGVAGVTLTPGTTGVPGTPVTAGTFPSAGAFAASFAVGGQSVADGFEGPVAYFVTVKDAAGNAGTGAGAANIDNAGPQVSAVSVATSADATRVSDGRKFYKATGGTNLTVTATIRDASGVVNPCLKVLGAGGTPGSCVAGSAAGNTFTFLLPRSAGATSDGVAPVQFVITADDGLVAAASGAEKARHQTQSAATDVYFDTTAPAVAALAVDTTWYAKVKTGANYTLPVTASFTEAGVGVDVVAGGTLTVGSTTVQSTSCTATACTFALPTSAATGGAEGALAFTVTVQDLLGNVSSSQAGARNLDDKGPTLPSAVTVTPPAAGTWFGPGTSITVTAVFADGGSGVGTSAALRVSGAAGSPYAGVAGAAGSFVFTVPANDLVADGAANGTIAFTVEASDAVLNASGALASGKTLAVDRKAPTLTPVADATWHLASATVPVTGAVTDSDSGTSGGKAGALVNPGSALSTTGQVAGSIASGTYTVSYPLAGLTLTGVEAAQAFFLAVSDAAGNAATSAFSINVDDKAPAIGNLQVTTAGDFTRVSDGRKFYKATPGANTLTITADISDAGAGVVTTNAGGANAPCIRDNTSGTPGACLATGALTSGTAKSGTYTFLLPRSAGAGSTGATPLQFVITAEDTLAAVATGAEQARHQKTSGNLAVYFDDVGPTVTLAADTKVYAKRVSGNTFSLTATFTVTDAGAGASTAGTAITATPLNGSGSALSGSCSGTGTVTCTYTLPSSLAADGAEGAANTVSLVATAVDNVANPGTSAAGTWTFDDKAPTVTHYKVWKTSTTEPVTDGVATPVAVAGTGYNGIDFIYNDTVTVKVTLADSGAGIAPQSLKIKVGNTGAVAQNPDVSGCAAGAAACTVSVTVRLNDQVNTGSFTPATGEGPLAVVVTATDTALAGDGVTAAGTNALTSTAGQTANINATRFWWSKQLTDNVSGIAIFPDGELVATVTAGATRNSVFKLHADGILNAADAANPAALTAGITWQKGQGFYGATDLGSIQGAPAIGADAVAANAKIYVATVERISSP